MPRHVLVAGPAGLLGSHLAALQLSSSEDVVSLLVSRPEGALLDAGEATALVRHAARQLAQGTDEESHWARLASRLHPLRGEEALSDVPPIDEVWWLGTGAKTDDEALRRLLPRLPALGVKALHVVGPALAGAPSSLEAEVEAACGASGIAHHLFRTGMTVAEAPPLEGPDREGLLLLLEALHELKSEVEERLPGHFATYPLRLWAPAGASLNLVRADQAAACMLRLARSGQAQPRGIGITSPEQLPFEQLCARVGQAYGLKLQVVANRDALNAIDRSLEERLAGFHTRLTPPGGPAPAGSQAELHLDAEAQTALFQRILLAQQHARSARVARAARLFDTLAPRTVDRAGTALSYRVAGTGGSAVVLLNALGQGLYYWSRLMDALARHHRVILWEPRGTELGPHPFKLKDQVDDLEAILQHEGIDACHLVGWCTGPKVAVEFYLRRPAAVTSMVFLNGTFKCAGSPKELDTPYERNFEPLCGILDRRPAMAASVLKSLRLSMGGDGGELAGEPDSEELATRVLALMNRDLRTHVLAPFRNEAVVVNYARQLVDFWSYDTRKSAGQVRAPVLLISAEHDAVASPEASRRMVELFPHSRHIHVNGATHYCLYDRPRFVSALLEEFFRASTGQASHTPPEAKVQMD